MEKVTVPKEVAEAIENARRRGASDFVILNRAVNGVVTVSNEIIRKWAFGQDGGSPDLLMRAIVNGYQVEQTPEEKLRDYYEALNTSETWEPKTRKGVEQTLDILGITIEGINA